MNSQTLICPFIHQVPLPDDIVTVHSHVYSRKALLSWLERNNTLPITGEQISAEDIVEIPILVRLSSEIHFTPKIYNFKISNILYNDNISIDLWYEKNKLKNIIRSFALDQDLIIFGSNAYLSYIHNTNLVNYFMYTKSTGSNNYNDPSYHPESFISRQEMKKINDIDILATSGDIDIIIDKITKLLKHCKINKKEISYKSSNFIKYTQNAKLDVFYPIGLTGSIKINIDLVVITDNRYKSEPYPNIIKKIIQDKYRYYIIDYTNLPLNYHLELLKWCKKCYNNKVTITNIFYYGQIIFNHENLESLKCDIWYYIRRLYKELELYKINNLSTEIVDTNKIKFILFNDNEKTDEFIIIDMDNYINFYNQFDCNIDEMCRGKLNLNNGKSIYISCDPDFNINEYSLLLYECYRYRYV